MKAEPNSVVAELEIQSARPVRSLGRRLLKYSLLLGIPLLLLPSLLPRKVSARRLSDSNSAVRPTAREAVALREKDIQVLVDDFKSRLSIDHSVIVSIVDRNELVVSVERSKDDGGTFS